MSHHVFCITILHRGEVLEAALLTEVVTKAKPGHFYWELLDFSLRQVVRSWHVIKVLFIGIGVFWFLCLGVIHGTLPSDGV